MSPVTPVTLGGRGIGPGHGLFLIAGPCVLEDPDEMLALAEEVAGICAAQDVGYCFKSSYRKDNRTSAASFRGPGLEEGLKLLAQIGEAVGVPVLTDIHHPDEADAVAQVADVLQIPAFLCRQTSLLEAAGRTGRIVNIKKGQFLAAADLAHAAAKVQALGDSPVLLTERGSFFGYRDLVVDFRNIAVMSELGFPVVFDATHSVQSPGSTGSATGGRPEMIPLLARCGVAAGCDAVFLEVHPEPARARSDAASQLAVGELPGLLAELVRYRALRLEGDS